LAHGRPALPATIAEARQGQGGQSARPRHHPPVADATAATFADPIGNERISAMHGVALAMVIVMVAERQPKISSPRPRPAARCKWTARAA
jgi:hypothetical protein